MPLDLSGVFVVLRVQTRPALKQIRWIIMAGPRLCRMVVGLSLGACG